MTQPSDPLKQRTGYPAMHLLFLPLLLWAIYNSLEKPSLAPVFFVICIVGEILIAAALLIAKLREKKGQL